jgi:nitrogen-specific signal transduction histidine kinase
LSKPVERYAEESAETLRAVNAELEKALADLKATQQQIIQQERLRALGEMASGIAHDFNNALMPVLGFAELLLISPAILDDKKKTAEYIEFIRTAAKDAASIVARLREFYRSNDTADVFAPVDLKQLAKQAVALTRPKWKDQAQAHGIAIHVGEDLADVPPVEGDESALREVLTNLIFNAVDAMPQGGEIVVHTRCERERAVLEVADTGMGMTDEVRRRCLEPFFSTKGERGTGLGLAMVFGIVQRHKGNIQIESEPGQGTKFIVTLPPHKGGEQKANGASGASAERPVNVLIVDDEPQIREVLAAYLEMDGHAVQTANGGTSGLRCFMDGHFDLVITDRAMPGMSGEQMAIAIKKFSPKTPIMLLSGFNSAGEEETFPGVDVVAAKPITMPDLREKIGRALQAA